MLNERLQCWSPVQGGIPAKQLNCHSLTERTLLSSQSIWRAQLLHLKILCQLLQLLATCKFSQRIELMVSSSHSIRLRFICKVFLFKDIPFNEVLSCAYKVGSHSRVWIALIDIQFRRNRRWVFILIARLVFREQLQALVSACQQV